MWSVDTEHVISDYYLASMSGERARVRHQAAEEVRRGEGEGVPGGPGEL